MGNIIWRKPDGGVAVTHLLQEAVRLMDLARSLASKDDLTDEERAKLEFIRSNIGLSEEAHAEVLISRAMSEVERLPIFSYEAVAFRQSVPADRTFRDAWIWDGSAIAHDMAKCREIHKNRMRHARKPLLEALDVEYMRANEAGDVAKRLAVVKKKQELRDVTADPRIESAKTPEELKAVWPECLK